MKESQSLEVKRPESEAPLMPNNVMAKIEAVRDFQSIVKTHLVERYDYGTIPGTGKPTLLKAGAEKIVTLFGARPHFTVVEKIEMWDSDKPIFYYHYKCEIIHVETGSIIGEGEGSCNSKEDKYAYRNVFFKDLPAHLKTPDGKKALPTVPVKWKSKKAGGSYPVFRLDNTEIFSIVNTIQKMAQKRAMVAAALVLGRLSDLFTQDMEDIAQVVAEPEHEPETPQKKATAKKAPAPSGKKTSTKEGAPGATTKEKTTPSPTEKTETQNGGDDFIKATRADSEKVIEFIVENDRDIHNNSDAWNMIVSFFEEKDITVETVGGIISSNKMRGILFDYMQEAYGDVPAI